MRIFYFINDVAYFKFTVMAGEGDSFVTFSRQIHNGLLKKLYRYHNAWPCNRFFELPFRSFWLNYLMGDFEAEDSDDLCIIMSEAHCLSYSKKSISVLRRRFSKARICLLLVNPIDDGILERINYIRDSYNSIITFNKPDAIKYDLLYNDVFPFKLPILQDDSLEESDIFFVGADKGRLELLLKLYDKLTSLGYKCNFHITEVPVEKQVVKDGITYNGWMDYETVLKYTEKTKCVLEYIKGDYISQRTQEALTYHKKILTTNKNAKELPYYGKIIYLLEDDVNKMDFSFIRKKVDDSEYEKYIDFRNFDSFKSFLKDNVK